MAYVVYTKARLRNIPLSIIDPNFRVLRCNSGLSLSKQGVVLFAPNIHDALRKRGSAMLGVKMGVQGAIGGVG